MFRVQTLNQIAEKGLQIFDGERYEVGEGLEHPDGILLRSFSLHQEGFSKDLKAIARAGAGVNNIPVERCTERGIVVFNTPGANANAVKELILAGLIMSSRNIISGVSWAAGLEGQEVPQLVEAGKKQFVGSEIAGKRLGVIGLGAIGALVANDALSLGMDVVGYDPYISVETAWRLSTQVQRAFSLDEIFSTCDYITLHIPLTDQTRGIIGEHAVQTMKKGVRLFNFSRGELVDEVTLAKALEEGIINHYVTDFPNENVIKMKNVTATPHLGASTYESEENCAIMAARQLRDYLETGNIHNSVNYPNVELPYVGKKRITIMHQNVPNMVGQITGCLAEHHINIADMINRSKGSFAYTMIDIDNGIDDIIKENVVGNIKGITGVVAVRMIV
ncbi:3-phosphoglycerate dehydrogenase [Bacillus cereus]|uniref:3-phosphoglycerate dehydrogenase family protein n=1 Tax=unclassified Bacillus (in: firmicutes) TaxID=185979 RepID=UPI00089C36C6|nr:MULTISPECIES: 3-phosphoglycerate dehydrogenase family protein [unclassified Bacillus (in: firmicutes)]PFE03278.1 3-phosphoglycerate dehydrogenase [Bacillus sp. AFS023182]PGY02178.1 3-phosphoglycerate dehydrogenase [Bacillus cereus]SDY94603.1 D-3-phosphoglycerate dehydrogenase [Bacillus sp. 166amftsu]